MTQRISVIDFKARCKGCSGKPTHYCHISGLTYSSQKYLRVSKSKIDTQNYYYGNLNIQWQNQKTLISGASIRGRSIASSYHFKKHKNRFAYYRILVSCSCGESTWMSTTISSNPSAKHRKLMLNLEDYEYCKSEWDMPSAGKANTRS